MLHKSRPTDRQVSIWQQLIARKARRYFQQRLSAHDLEDACSQAIVRLLERLVQFNPHRAAIDTFVDRVVESALRDFDRGRRAQKRGGGKAIRSLNSTVAISEDETCQAWQTVNEQARLRIRPDQYRDPVADRDLALDLKHVKRRLTTKQREVVEWHLAGYSASEISRHLNIARGTVYRRLESARKRLRLDELQK